MHSRSHPIFQAVITPLGAKSQILI